ncbi:MAG: transglutaminase-like domain-containing protein [Candidatus Bathyarchaeota archaeon]|nr:transglutaminase-like domain-containing protein [Candidatus Bathyarchaeota archaeon]
MKKFTLAFSAVIIIASLTLAMFLSLNAANTQNSGDASDLTKLQEEYEELQEKYYALLGNFSALEYDYQSILLQNPFSVPNPSGSGSADTQQMLSRYQALQQMYISLQNEYNQYVADYEKLKSITDQRLMRGDLKSLITPNNPEVMNLTYSITGKVGNTTDPNAYWKDIKAIYDWVNTNIEYRDDGLYPILPETPAEAITEGLQQTDQTAQLPNETLHVRMGDCEDIAALLTSMIRSYFSNQFLVECIWITGQNAGHVAVVIPFSGDQIVILDPIRDYYSHDTLGNIALNTISSEIYNWMQIWRPSLGNDVHVYRVFSDYMDQYFDDTEEYINWMYNR